MDFGAGTTGGVTVTLVGAGAINKKKVTAHVISNPAKLYNVQARLSYIDQNFFSFNTSTVWRYTHGDAVCIAWSSMHKSNDFVHPLKPCHNMH